MEYNKYSGSGAWLTSVGNEELIASEKITNNITATLFYAKEFDFYNKTDCVVKVNDSDEILIPTEVGFYDNDVTKFQILTAGIVYCYRIKY
jgi:hypothetical protein